MPHKVLTYRHRGKPTDALKEQELFHKIRKPYALFAGGFGSGKTLTICMEAHQILSQHPGSEIAIIRRTMPELRRTTMKEFFKLLGVTEGNATDSQFIKRFDKNRAEGEYYNGSLFYFIPADHDFVSRVKSNSYSLMIFDELTHISKDNFLYAIGRLRHEIGPCTIRAATNPNGHDWVWSFFHPDSPERNPDSDIIIMDSERNHYLPKNYISRLKRTYSQDWVNRFVHASFNEFSGLVYKSFRPHGKDSHVQDFDPSKFPKDWLRFAVMDWGYQNPCAAYKGAKSHDDVVYFWAEHFYTKLPPSEHAKTFAKWIEEGHLPFLADPSVVRTESTGKRISDEFVAYGVPLTPAPNDRMLGFMRVETWFKMDKIRIHPSCKNLIRELSDYKWEDLPPGKVGFKNDPEDAQKHNDHGCDAIRYSANFFHVKTSPPVQISEMEARMHRMAMRTWESMGIPPQFADDVTRRDMERFERAIRRGRTHAWNA